MVRRRGRRTTSPRPISTGETTDEGDAIVARVFEGQTWSGEYWVRRRDGSRLPVHVTDTPVLGPDGAVVAVIAASVDLTERKKAEEALRRLSAIVAGSGDAIFGTTTDGMVTSWNSAAERLFGYTAQEIIGRPVALIATGEQTTEQAEVRARLIAGGPIERLELLRRRKDGSLVEVLVTASTATDEAGTVIGLSVVARDLTAAGVMRGALEASQRGLAVAQRIAQLGSFEIDPITGATTWSDELYRVLALDPSLDASGQLLLSMLHPDDLPTLLKAWAEVCEHGTPFDLVHRIIRGDAVQRYVRSRIAAEVAEDGTIKLVGTMMDDTDRIEAERVHQAAETRFEIGFEQAAIGAAIADLEGTALRVEPGPVLPARPAGGAAVGRRWTEHRASRRGTPGAGNAARVLLQVTTPMPTSAVTCGRMARWSGHSPTWLSCGTNPASRSTSSPNSRTSANASAWSTSSPIRRCTTRSPGSPTAPCSPTAWSTAWPAPVGGGRDSE